MLRKVGDRRMPNGVQASKWLVSTEVFHSAMQPDPDAAARDIGDLRAEVVLISEKLEALRKLVRPLLRWAAGRDGT